MKEVFESIKTQLQNYITQDALSAIGIETEQAPSVLLYNSQILRMEKGEQIPFALPAFIISFNSPNQWNQLGNGVQMLEPFVIKVRICREFYDMGDGTTDQDLIMFDLAELVYAALQLFIPTKCGNLVRITDTPDEDVTSMNVWIQEYRTCLIDSSQQLPIAGQESAPPYTLVLTKNPE